jgi:ABC-type branched-subunit amino acid transport system permease subunit
MFGVSILLVAGLALLLRRSWLGLGVRAAGQLPDTARLMGVRPAAVARFNWALGGALAGLAGVLYAPLTNINAATFTFLLVKTVGAALIGGLVSLPLTFAGGIALGLVETLLPHFWARPGSASVGVAALVVVALMINTKRLALYAAHAAPSAPMATPGRAALGLAESLVGFGDIGRRVPRVVWLAVALGAAALPLQSEFQAAVGLHIVFYGLAGLSLVLITGSAGQPSLMQMGFVGVGAYAITTAAYHGVSFGTALALGVACCFVVGLGVGFLTLRFRGVEFAILTLTLAAMVSESVLADPRLFSTLSTPQFLGLDLLNPRSAYFVMLGFTAVAFLIVRNVRRSAWGGALVSLRHGKRILAHSGGSATRMEATAFAISCAIAGLAGGVYALLVGQFGSFQFAPLYSITLLLAALVGGLRSLWGPVLTGVIFGVGPVLLQKMSVDVSNGYPQIVSSLLVLVLLVAAPDGLASLGDWARATLARAPSTPVFRGRPFPETSRQAIAGTLARSSEQRLLPRRAPSRPGAAPMLHRHGGGAVPRLPRAGAVRPDSGFAPANGSAGHMTREILTIGATPDTKEV